MAISNISRKRRTRLSTGKRKGAKRAVREQAANSALANDRTGIGLSTDRIHTLEELQASEQRFREFFTHIPDYCYIVSREGNILEVNRAALQALGYEREELIGKPLMTIYAPEISARMKKLFRRWQKTGEIINEEMVIKTKNGERRVVLLNVGSVRDRHGKIIHSTSVQTDITERKWMENALHENEARLKEAQRLAKIGYWELDLSTNTLIWSDEIYRIFEIDREIFGASYEAFLAAVHPEDREAVDTAYTESVANRIPYGITHRLLMQDGRIKYVREQCETYYSPEGKPLRSIGTVQNITELKQAENALRESEARLSLAADSAEAGLWSSDFKTGQIWATQKVRKLYGFPSNKNITYDKFIGILHPDDRDRVSRELQQAFRAGTNLRSEYRIVMPDGRVRWIKMQAKAFLKPSGKPDCMMGVSLDISQRKQNEDEMARLRLDLEHLNRVMTMNEISTSLAHEINQPLGAILNNASTAKILVAQINGSHEDISEILADIISDARRAGDIIRKIRGIVKKGDSHFEPIDINALIKDVAELLQNTFRIDNISLVLDVGQKIVLVMGDHDRLQQVLLNLIANALDAMKESASKTLTIRSTMTVPDTVTVSVTDSGTGIDDADGGKLFEPFFTTKKDGLGVGLRICRSIIEEHGGRIWAENNPDAGATFSFSLKARKGKPE